ncbi:DNA polymerase III subunit delta' [Microvirga arsenatis]|uniref:DNA polymerase III subunit delta n=1 Tax=Microvirga arsenatis TaxID=2692265 RepID=A0ABW9Z353_9HYPH|nr:DNA polymerase III subunit delta' [Microvirga arsenatis]NBJ13412.1 DNA polymerase III subunit delta' [Microvirga arsenatis]NBJ26970.1 DNA polymerase III subunit delta' [Microvirga arsenatis]
MSREPQGLPEPDQLEGTPHPREQFAFFGHEEGEGAFLEGLRSGRLHHAWLIGGAQGIGKATLAYRVARAVLDPRRSADRSVASLDVPPDSQVARQVAALSHPNLSVLRRAPATDKKAASTTIPVEAVRRALSMFGSTAADGGYRVCIVDSAEDLTVSSANALLKVIEEPPPRSLFLIVSHAPQRVLPTIRSRCRRLLLRPLGERDIKRAIAFLGAPWSDIPGDVVDQALRYGEGSVRRTLELLDEEKVAFIEQVTKLLNTLPGTDTKQVLALAEALSRRDAEDSYELALDTVQRWVSQRLHERAGLGASRLAPLVEVCEKIGRAAQEIDVFNLDRRPFILTMFDDLADAVRRAA